MIDYSKSFICNSIEEIIKKAGEGFSSELYLKYNDLDILVKFDRYICIKNCKVFDCKKNRIVYINEVGFPLKSFKGNFLNSLISKYKEEF